MSPNCVFDASLVPETCRDRFVDSKELIKQVFGESDNRRCKALLFRLARFLSGTTSDFRSTPGLHPMKSLNGYWSRSIGVLKAAQELLERRAVLSWGD